VPVHVRHQRQEVQLEGVRRVREVFARLQLNPEAYLVIRGTDLLTHDAELHDGDRIELRPVISGGGRAAAPAGRAGSSGLRAPGGPAAVCAARRRPVREHPAARERGGPALRAAPRGAV
jgi:sulfur carrier protein